ncbi:hypothetical protein BS78_10G148600 [Paspalum vaginatum]|nr:hypothetical protein BS78_10G148600 [Paspalum vaginatum]
MYPQVVYHAEEHARKKMETAERQMACCCPLGRMISRVLKGRDGRIRYDERMDYSMAYAPAQTCYVRPTAQTVTLSKNNRHPAHAMQPEPLRPHATTLPNPSAPFPAAGVAMPRKSKKKKKKRVQFTPSGPPVPADAPSPHTEEVAISSSGPASSVYHHGPVHPSSYSPAPPGHGHAYGYGRYAPSPLPRWEMLGTPRRHEYFSNEYRWYYPTPVREGIYSIATDANGRLSTIFSEENPNACSIV